MQLTEITKMSELLELAINDCKKLELSTYYPNHDVWHTHARNLVNEDSDKGCHVCLAGAVIAKTLKYEPSANVDPINFKDDVEMYFITALDHIKEGNWGEALSLFCMGLRKDLPYSKWEQLDAHMSKISLKSDFEGWKEFRRFLRDLEKALPLLKEAESKLNLYK